MKQEQELERQARNAQRGQSRGTGGMNSGGGEWDFSQPANSQGSRNQMRILI